MSTVLLGERRLDEIGSVSAYVGDTKDGRVGWIADAEEVPGGQFARTPPRGSVRIPDGVDVTAALNLLALWPGWRIARSADLELGSRVVVASDPGAGWLTGPVLTACGWHGCAWRAASGFSDAARSEYTVPDLGAGMEQVRRRLPQSPDSVILIGGAAAKQLPIALSLVTKMGRVVVGAANGAVDVSLYPDAHKRGLSIINVAPWTEAPAEDWDEAVVRIRRLAVSGASPASHRGR